MFIFGIAQVLDAPLRTTLTFTLVPPAVAPNAMALNSAARLMVLSVIGLAIAFVFRPQGLGVVFGMALFQMLLVFSTTLPVARKLRAGAATQGRDGAEGDAS